MLQERPSAIQVPKSFDVPPFDYAKRAERPFKQIYGRRDIFGTFQANKATKRNLVGAIPQLTLPQAPPPPERKAIDFIDPLNIALNGIMFAADEDASMCIITDETDKDKTYHVGDQLRDGSIIKIAQRSVVILRANGQQETYFLKEPGGLTAQRTPGVWIKALEQNKLSIDPLGFKDRFGSLGQFIEELGILPIFHGGQCTGMRIESEGTDGLTSTLGLQKGDVLTAINGISLTNKHDRLSAYESVIDSSYGGKVLVTLNRNNNDLTLTYILERQKAPPPVLMAQAEAPQESATEAPTAPVLSKEQFTTSKPKPNISRSREFKERHAKQYDENISAIRGRLLENMKTRPNRVRAR